MTPELPTMTNLYLTLISVAVIATVIIVWILDRAEEKEDIRKHKKDIFDNMK